MSLLCQKTSNSFPLCLGKKQISWACQESVVVKNLPANAGDIRDTGWMPESGRSPGEGNDNPHQYSCWENPLQRGIRWVTMGSQRVRHD